MPKKETSFNRKRYFWKNILYMIVTAFILLFLAFKAMDFYTHHGESVVVPEVKGMSLEQAYKVFKDKGLDCVVTDSSYVKTMPAGCVLDISPAVGQRVKEGRMIYITINTINVPLRPVPDVADNSSVRQAEAVMLASGFKLTENEMMPGDKDWVYGVKYNGRTLAIGAQVPAGSKLTLLVGDGTEANLGVDSISVDQSDGTTEDVSVEDGNVLPESHPKYTEPPVEKKKKETHEEKKKEPKHENSSSKTTVKPNAQQTSKAATSKSGSSKPTTKTKSTKKSSEESWF